MGWAVALVLLRTGGAAAQEPPPVPVPGPQTPSQASAERPGRFRVGPFYLTPSLRVGPIGLDTNVLYTPTDRRTDATATGGPALELVLPFRQAGRFSVEGGVEYLYFVRTSSQRKLNGFAKARLGWETARSLAEVEETYRRTLGRLGFEVDRRVRHHDEATRGQIKRRLFGRISLGLKGSRSRFEVEQDEAFLGTNLRRTLSRDEYTAGVNVGYALTVKTSFVVEGERRFHRFLVDTTRDADTDRVVGGIRTDPTALVSGHILGGLKRFRPRASTAGERRVTVADIDGTLNISRRTRLGGHYSRDLGYSAFDTSGRTPTLITETAGVRIDKDLIGRFNLRLFGRRTRLLTDGAITVVLPEQGRATAVRDDKAREAGADLGYRFPSSLRIGVTATYTKRRSTISYFGIQGLLVGATVTYTP